VIGTLGASAATRPPMPGRVSRFQVRCATPLSARERCAAMLRRRPGRRPPRPARPIHLRSATRAVDLGSERQKADPKRDDDQYANDDEPERTEPIQRPDRGLGTQHQRTKQRRAERDARESAGRSWVQPKQIEQFDRYQPGEYRNRGQSQRGDWKNEEALGKTPQTATVAGLCIAEDPKQH